MANTHWGNEGDFRWLDLPQGTFELNGRWPSDRYRHPFFVLRNNATGEHFAGQLAWSGGYRFLFDLDAPPATTESAAQLSFHAGLHGPAPQRVLAPRETVCTPEMHLGAVFGDLDAAAQAMHEHLRHTVLMPQPRGRGGWIESGIGPEIEVTEEQGYHAIECAQELGAEIFFIDAGWYAPPREQWWATVGDWDVDRQRFPNGLAPFREQVHSRGMLWGLWMDAERIGPDSRAAKEHPQWILHGYDGRELGGMLDLTNPEAARWMEERIRAVIEAHRLDFLRLDFNTGGCGRTDVGMALPPEHMDRLIGGQSGHTAAELDSQWRLSLFGRPTFAFPKPMRSARNPLLLARVRHCLTLYKDFVRPMMPSSRICHHTPVAAGPEPHGWGVLELASDDRARCICGLFQLGCPTQPEYPLRCGGLDLPRRYRVIWDNSGQECEIDGPTLMSRGITVRLEGALRSELLIVDALQH